MMPEITPFNRDAMQHSNRWVIKPLDSVAQRSAWQRLSYRPWLSFLVAATHPPIRVLLRVAVKCYKCTPWEGKS
jgi:hypothetical protein